MNNIYHRILIAKRKSAAYTESAGTELSVTEVTVTHDIASSPQKPPTAPANRRSGHIFHA